MVHRAFLLVAINMWLGIGNLSAHDTLLVDFKLFHTSIDRISDDGHGTICISTAMGVYLFDGETFRWLRANRNREFFVFWEGKIRALQSPWRDTLFESDKKKTMAWEPLLPVGSAQIVCEARDKKGRIWISKGQYLLCFEINQYFHLSYRGKSIRGVLPTEKGLFVATYAGMYQNEHPILFDNLYAHGYLFRWKPEEILIPYRSIFSYNMSTGTYSEFYSNTDPANFNILNFDTLGARLYVATTIGLRTIKGDSLVATPFDQRLEDLFVHQGQIFMATYHGIYSGDGIKSQKVHAFPDLHFNSIQNIRGTWWATSVEGIWKWEQGEANAVQLFKGQELSKLETYCLVQDEQGYMWASCISGIVRFAPDGEHYEHYLRQIEFNKRSAAQQGDRIYFGSLNGLFDFRPSLFGPIQAPPKSPQQLPDWMLWLLLGSLAALGFFTLYLYRKWKKVTRLLEKNLSEQADATEPFLEDLETYIHHHIRHVTVDSLLAHTGLSRRALYQVLEKTHGIKPGDLIRHIKLKRIQEIIQENPTISEEELSEMVGYSPAYIARILKQE